MSADVEAAINETIERARPLLFDDKGKRRPEAYFIALFTLQSVLRPATIAEAFNPQLGQHLFDWAGKTYLYDTGLGEMCLADAHSEPFFDQVLCNAAAAMLEAKGGIPDPRLRAYVCGRLTSGIAPVGKRGRGRTGKDTWGRDAVIVGRLIPPLLDRFSATRNKATRSKDGAEFACSIVTKALSKVRHNMTEKRVEDIWGKHSHVLAK